MNSTTEAPERLIGAVEAARRSQINRTTLWRWVERGILRAQRTPTGQLKFRVEDIDAILRPAGPSA